jgi:hypothetical protein
MPKSNLITQGSQSWTLTYTNGSSSWSLSIFYILIYSATRQIGIFLLIMTWSMIMWFTVLMMFLQFSLLWGLFLFLFIFLSLSNSIRIRRLGFGKEFLGLIGSKIYGFKRNMFFGLKCILKENPIFITITISMIVLMISVFCMRLAEYKSAFIELYLFLFF